MIARKCARCGADPAPNPGVACTPEGTFYLCHPGDISGPDCYTIFQWEWSSEHCTLPQHFVIGGAL